jgi:hypothetical protein
MEKESGRLPRDRTSLAENVLLEKSGNALRGRREREEGIEIERKGEKEEEKEREESVQREEGTFLSYDCLGFS